MVQKWKMTISYISSSTQRRNERKHILKILHFEDWSNLIAVHNNNNKKAIWDDLHP